MKHKILSDLHPLKAIPEAIWGYDSFRGKKMPSVPGEKVVYFGARIDPRVAHLLSTFRIIQETNRFWWGSDDPILNRVIYAGVGKNYEFDIKGMKTATYYHTMNKIIAGDEGLIRGIKRAEREGDTKTATRLKQQIRKLKREVAKYKP